MTTIDTAPRLDGIDTGGDEPNVAHIGWKDEVARAYIEGCSIIALCGVEFRPSRDPERYPVCQECVAVRTRITGDPG